MDQVSQEYLFKVLWKNVFILDKIVHRDNRISNYLGLKFLYSLNKEGFKKLINSSEDIFFNSISGETIDSFNSEVIKVDDIISCLFYESNSRIMNLIKFIQEHTEIYSVLNDYAKGQIENSINNMYVKNGISRRNNYRNQYQSRLEITTIYFKKISADNFKQSLEIIDNYYINSNFKVYDILYKSDIDVILNQSKYYGLENEVIEFIIEYCSNAKYFVEADSLFNVLMFNIDNFTQDNFCMILTKININGQYWDNRNIKDYIKELDKIFNTKLKYELFSNEEIKFLNKKVYSEYISIPIQNIDYLKVLQILNLYIEFYDDNEIHMILDECISNLGENIHIEIESIKNIITYNFDGKCNKNTIKSIKNLENLQIKK